MMKVVRNTKLRIKLIYNLFISQLIVAFCISSLVSAQAQGPGPYGPEKFAPQPYSYQYGVADEYSKANFQKTESQDASVRVKKQTVILFLNLCFQGNVQGSFMIALPDGRIQTTKYTADHVGGFIAEVTYQGEAVYPKEIKPYSAN